MPSLCKKVLSGVYPPIPKIYSEGLSKIIKSMLQVEPSKRISCEEILESQFVIMNASEIIQQVDNALAKGEILGTIKIPKNLHQLGQNLPKSNYDSQNYTNSNIVNLKNEMKDDDKFPTQPRFDPIMPHHVPQLAPIQEEEYKKKPSKNLNENNIKSYRMKLESYRNEEKKSAEQGNYLNSINSPKKIIFTEEYGKKIYNSAVQNNSSYNVVNPKDANLHLNSNNIIQLRKKEKNNLQYYQEIIDRSNKDQIHKNEQIMKNYYQRNPQNDVDLNKKVGMNEYIQAKQYLYKNENTQNKTPEYLNHPYQNKKDYDRKEYLRKEIASSKIISKNDIIFRDQRKNELITKNNHGPQTAGKGNGGNSIQIKNITKNPDKIGNYIRKDHIQPPIIHVVNEDERQRMNNRIKEIDSKQRPLIKNANQNEQKVVVPLSLIKQINDPGKYLNAPQIQVNKPIQVLPSWWG